MIRAYKRDPGSLALLSIYVRKWFPGRKVNEESMAEAAFLEWDFWEKLGNMLGGKED